MTIALITTIGGALVYCFTQGKPCEMGRIAYFAGLFWLLSEVAKHSVHF